MLVRAVFAAVGAFVSELVPAQGIRSVPQGEMYAGTLNGRLPREKDLAGVTANGTAPARHTDPAAPGAAVTPAGDIPPSPAGRSPYAELTNGDLVQASRIVRVHCDRMDAYGFPTTELRALAERLFDAGTPDPNP